MRKKRFLAIAAALAVSMAFLSMPTAALATEPGEDYGDIADDGQEAGEQTTVAEPGADNGPGSDGTGSSGSTSGNSGSSGSSGGSSGGSSSQGSAGGASASKSSDSSLASLGISPGSLSPSFSPGTYEYTATVDADVTRVSIPARPNSSKAVIASVSGAKSIRPGTNTVKVVVEAENGTTSTYTITVYCGQGAQDAPAAQPQDTGDPEPASVEGEISDTGPRGEIEGIGDAEEPEDEEKDQEISFDSNGYLIYKGSAYIPSELMPEGEYVSLDKYNKLYEQAQSDKTKSNRMMIVFVVALVLLVIVIINLGFKLRDVRQDAKLGIGGFDDDDEGDLYLREQRAQKAAKASKIREKTPIVGVAASPDVKMREQPKPNRQKAPERAAAIEKTQPVAGARAAGKTPERPSASARTPDRKKSRSARADRDLEILDLNDL